MAGGLKRKRKGRKGAAKKENPCRVCEFGGISHCICPGEKDEMSSTILSDPKVKDRDVYVRLRTLIEAADSGDSDWRKFLSRLPPSRQLASVTPKPSSIASDRRKPGETAIAATP